MSQRKIITGLGYCGVDHLCIVPRIPIDDKVQAVKILEQGGGPVSTAIVAASRLGAQTVLISALGSDSRADTILKDLAREGVDTSSIKLRLGAESPVAFCWIQQDSGKRSIVWNHGSVNPLLPEEVNVKIVRESGLLHLDGHHIEAAIRAAETAREAGTVVMLDAGTIVPGIESLMELADIIIASEKFAENFTGEKDSELAVEKLFVKNTMFAAVTLGIKGSIGFAGGKLYHQAAMQVEVVDTTGAGDVFHGAFAYKYINGGKWQECMCFASAVAALKCTKLGGRTGIPDLITVNNFLEQA